LNSIHDAVLKFKNYITEAVAFIVNTLIEPLLAIFHDPAGHFGQNGSNFLGYRLLKTFQSLGTMLTSSSSKKVRTPHTKLKNGTPHSNLGAVEWLLVKFPRVIVRPVPAILFVDCA
jgi:hypothetical protein